jgi:2,3-bisphosphoglycerate-independent phosphoglycerate mutase
MIWPWSPGKMPGMPPFRKKYGLKGAVITAVHLLKGMGRTMGLEVINVPGATGYLDTNYVGKARYALRALKKNDLVFVHVESPDEAGHEGSIKHKIKAIEDFDSKVVGTVLKGLRPNDRDVRILVLPDHPTPIRLMTHTAEAVPFAAYPRATGNQLPVTSNRGRVMGYNEREIGKSKIKIKDGHKLLKLFVGGGI